MLPGWLQVTQAPVQGPSQQTPSMHAPDWHSALRVQAAASAREPQPAPSQPVATGASGAPPGPSPAPASAETTGAGPSAGRSPASLLGPGSPGPRLTVQPISPGTTATETSAPQITVAALIIPGAPPPAILDRRRRAPRRRRARIKRYDRVRRAPTFDARRAAGHPRRIGGEPLFTSSYPFDEQRIRAASIYCSDGRYGEQIDEFLHQQLGLPRYDRLAIPGGPACLSTALGVFWESRGAEQQLDFLCRVHGLERIVLIAHEGCAFYRDWLKVPPTRMEKRQRADLAEARDRIQRMRRHLVVDAYFARRDGSRVRFDPVPL